MQQSLFNDDKSKATKGNLQVKIVKPKPSKNQAAFNRLTTRINNLRKSYTQKEQELQNLLLYFMQTVYPLKTELGHAKIAMAKALAEAAKKTKISHKRKEEIEGIIYSFLDDAFGVIEPDEDAKNLYASVADATYDEEIQFQKENLKDVLQSQVKDIFGVDIDMSEFDDSPESFEKFHSRLEEEMRKKEEKNQTRKKTKRQLDKEQAVKEQEEIKNKSLRSIYLGLVKLLHPDPIMDEAEKKEKEEIMKQVTLAYSNNDLPTLLKLEMEWVSNETGHLDKLTDDKLKIYISVLKEQVQEMEMEYSALITHPRYMEIGHISFMKESLAKLQIDHDRIGFTNTISLVKKHTEALKGSKTNAAITACLDEFFQEDEDFDFFGF